MRHGIVIQARMSSRRLPGKVLRHLRGRPILDHVVERASRGGAELADVVAVATSTSPEDDAIETRCAALGVACVRGPLDDVAARFAVAVGELGLDAFTRICADSPLIDPAVIRRAITLYRDGDHDLVTNVHPRTFPPGQSVEVLRAATFVATRPSFSRALHREHVTRYFYEHDERFRILNFESDRDYGDASMTVDTPADLARLELSPPGSGSSSG